MRLYSRSLLTCAGNRGMVRRNLMQKTGKAGKAKTKDMSATERMHREGPTGWKAPLAGDHFLLCSCGPRQAAGCRRVTPLCVEEEYPLRQAFELGWYHDAFVPLGADAFLTSGPPAEHRSGSAIRTPDGGSVLRCGGSGQALQKRYPVQCSCEMEGMLFYQKGGYGLMRQTQLLSPTLRQAPADAEAASHQMLVRAGYIRPLASGVYSYLPLGWRVMRQLEHIIREEMERAGAQELHLLRCSLPSCGSNRDGTACTDLS